MVLNVFKVLIHAYYLKKCFINFLMYAYYFSIPDHCLLLGKCCFHFFYLVQHFYLRF